MKRKVGRPRGSGPAQLIRAVLVEEFYLAVKELEQRGTPLSELLADQLDADPLGTLTKLKDATLSKLPLFSLFGPAPTYLLGLH